ncbi:MAG: osmotically inducible protein OsmC [Planctomycetes bacterium]|jgi:putative redox protein|nr:osmotically inducible protein OsmC [Planctomycetota bacterium]MDP6425121.1 OsmC family protein [Planctomycetota bacterium]
MVEIHLEYRGDLHTEAVHGPSSTRLETDAPKDNQGRGDSYSPTDLLATALGTCMVTIMAMAARERGIELAGTRVRVEKHMVKDPRRRVGRLDVDFDVVPGVPGEHRAVLEEAARTCPVAETISERTQVQARFSYRA